MVSNSSSASATPPEAPLSAGEREASLTTLLVFGAMTVGAVAQIWIPPGPTTLVAATGIASLVVLGLSFVVPGRLRSTLSGFRFTSSLLIALAIFAILGTLILQGKPAEIYRARYGAVAGLILALRFDDIFHGLPYAGLMALFGAAILASATLRWPISARRAGFFIAHVGLLISGAGAAASSMLSVRGRIDLFAGGDVAHQVRVTRNGVATGAYEKLPFELKLDQFDLVNYETEYRIGYYEKIRIVRDGVAMDDYRLKTSFDPDLAWHRLPQGDRFRLKAIYPDFEQVVRLTPAAEGPAALRVTLAGRSQWLQPGELAGTPDGTLAVAFGDQRPTPPPGYATTVLVSLLDRQVVVHRADGDATQPLTEGLALFGGVVRFEELLPHSARGAIYQTRSREWRNPAVVVESELNGRPSETLATAAQPRGIFLRDGKAALVFEKRDKEVKAFLSHVTARQGNSVERAVISVNDPFDFGGWMLYQVNYNPDDPTYSGLEAVRDPGVLWVFVGFALICVGVFYMLYVEPRLRGGGIERLSPSATSAATL
jgi:ResB-like family